MSCMAVVVWLGRGGLRRRPAGRSPDQEKEGRENRVQQRAGRKPGPRPGRLGLKMGSIGMAAGRACPMRRESSHSEATLPLASGGRTGFSARSPTCRRRRQGLRSAPGPGPPREIEAGPRENERASDGTASPLPEEAAPGYHDACRAVNYVAGIGLQRGPMQARNHIGNSWLFTGRVDNSRPAPPPPLPHRAAPDSRDVGGVGLWPRPPSPPPPSWRNIWPATS